MTHLIKLLSLLAVLSLACNRSVSTTGLPSKTPIVETYRTPTISPKAVSTMQIAQVIAVQSLNLRVRAGADQPVITTLLNGEHVEVVGQCRNGWVQIEYKKWRGFVNAHYLSGAICQSH